MAEAGESLGATPGQAASRRAGRPGARHGRRPSIRAAPLQLRVVLLVIMAITPALVFVLLAGDRDRRTAVARAQDRCLEAAHVVALEHEGLFTASRSLLSAVALMPAVRDGDWAATEAVLRSLGESDPRYANLGVIGADGWSVATVVRQGPEPVYLGDRSYFRKAVASRSFSVGAYQVGRLTGRPSINVGMPVFDATGAVSAVAFAALDLEWLNRRAIQARLPPSSTLTILDESGRVLVRHAADARTEAPGADVSGEPVVARMMRETSGVTSDVGADGVPRLYGFVDLRTSSDAGGGVVVISVPHGVALSDASAVLRDNLLALLAVTLLAAALAVLLGHVLLVRRFRRFLDVVRRLSAGDLEARTGARPGGGELSEVELAFDEMASSLAGRAEQLREAEEQYRHLVEEMPAIFYVARADDGRTFTFLSRQVARLGVDAKDLLGAQGAWEELIHPADRDEVVAEYRRARDAGRPFSAQYRMTRGDGRWLWFNDTCVFMGEGDHRGCRGFLLDVTAARLAEEQFLQAQRLEAVGRLASGVAHDFNNLLTVINGYSQVVLGQTRPDDPRLPDLEEIHRAGRRGTELTQQLLSFARRQPVQTVLTDLGDILAGAERMLRRLIGADVRLEVVRGVEPCLVRADPVQVEQAIVNLAVNARDAMPGGGTLRMETSVAPAVAPSGGADEAAGEGRRPEAAREALLSVTDTGVGIDPETQARIFEPFFTTKGPGRGTGLGLASVYGIVTQHGGTVTVRSEPGRGTTFDLRFPLAAAPEAPAAPGAAGKAEAAAAGHATVLLVDDEDRVRDVVRGMLESSGHAVLEARDGREALEVSHAHAGPIDLLLADSAVPFTSGAELARRLRAERPLTKVLLMSGHAAGSIVGPGAPGEGLPFIQKPFRREALDRVVREVLGTAAPLAGPG